MKKTIMTIGAFAMMTFGQAQNWIGSLIKSPDPIG